MQALFSPRLMAAGAAFAAVALAVLTLALMVEGSRRMLRRRGLVKQLSKLSSKVEVGGAQAEGGLLRVQPGELPEWLAPIAARIPSFSDLAILLEQSRSTWSVSTF